MKLIEKAKLLFPAFSETEIIANSCPIFLKLGGNSKYCNKLDDMFEESEELCTNCWNQEVGLNG